MKEILHALSQGDTAPPPPAHPPKKAVNEKVKLNIAYNLI